METLNKMYTRLFNGITDALEALERQDYGVARELLVRAQQDAEELYICEEKTGRVK